MYKCHLEKRRKEARENWLTVRRLLIVDRIKIIFTDTLIRSYFERHHNKCLSVLNETSVSRNWREAFQKVLGNESARDAFMQFLEREHSEENLLFWMAVEEIRLLEDESIFVESIRKIYETFVSEQSPLSINIDHEIRARITKRINRVDDQLSRLRLFDEAQLQIYELMKNDCFGRFVQTESYGSIESNLCLCADLCSSHMKTNVDDM